MSLQVDVESLHVSLSTATIHDNSTQIQLGKNTTDLHDNGERHPTCNSPTYPNQTNCDRSLLDGAYPECRERQQSEQDHRRCPYVPEEPWHLGKFYSTFLTPHVKSTAEAFNLSIFIITFYREKTMVTSCKKGKYAAGNNSHYVDVRFCFKWYILRHTYAV